MKELLLYIDPGFLDKRGHYRNFSDNIHEEALKRGVDIWHFVNKDVSEDVQNKYNLENVFHYKAILKDNIDFDGINSPYLFRIVNTLKYQIFDRLHVIRNFKLGTSKFKSILMLFGDLINNYNSRVLKSFYKVLDMILLRVSKCDYDKISIYMYTSHPLYFSIFAELLNSREFSDLNIKAYLGLFYLNLNFCMNNKVPKYEKILRTESDLLEKFDPLNKIAICSDSERTINRYSSYFFRPIKLCPIPLGINAKQPLLCHKTDNFRKRITIGYFGYPHIKQGYQLVRKLYQEIISNKKYSSVNFIVRHNINLVMDDLIRLVDDFMKENKRITHLVGDLSIEKYNEHLSYCDIIVIPHSKHFYPCQTSGLFVDSLRNAKVVIVPDDTWMADIIKNYGSGETFQSDNIESFLRSTIKVCDNFEYYQTKTNRELDNFSCYHSAKTLFDIMEIGQHSRLRNIQKKKVHTNRCNL